MPILALKATNSGGTMTLKGSGNTIEIRARIVNGRRIKSEASNGHREHRYRKSG